MAIITPNIGQPGVPGIPLMPGQMPGQTMPQNGAPAAPVSPFDQQFLASAAQAGQLVNWQQQPGQPGSQTGGQSSTPGTAELFGSGLASLVASAKATGPLIAATWDVLTGNKADEQTRLTNANKDLTDPVLGFKPLNAMSNEEKLGTAVEAAGVGAGGAGAPITSGALFGAGHAMQTDQGVGGIATDAGIGAVGGKVLDMASPAIGKIAGSAFDALVPQAAKDALGTATNAVSKFTQNIVPDIATSGVLKDTIETYAPTIKSLFVSSVDNSAASTALGTALQKTGNLKSVLGNQLGDFSAALGEQFPETKVSFSTSQVKTIQTAATKAGLILPDFMDVSSTASVAGQDVTSELGKQLPGVDLNITQTQQLESKLNEAYEKGFVSSVKQDVRQTAINQLNTAHPGLGTVYDQMFETASTGYNALETLSDTFGNSSTKGMTATQINARIAKVQSMMSDPQQKAVFMNILKNSKDLAPLNLSTEADALNAANNIKQPVARRAAKAVWGIIKKEGGWVGTLAAAHEIFKK